MDIEKATSEVTNFLKEDTPESIKTTLENVKREFGTMQISLGAANEESRKRKEKIRNLQEELEDAKSLVSKLSDDTQMREMKAEHEAKIKQMQEEYENKITGFESQNAELLESRNQLHKIFKDEVVADLTALKDHPSFEKVKMQLKLPEIKDDQFNFDEYSDADALFTKTKLAEYKQLGLFGKEENLPASQIPLTEKWDDIDIEQLAITNPKEAQKIIDKRRKTSLFG